MHGDFSLLKRMLLMKYSLSLLMNFPIFSCDYGEARTHIAQVLHESRSQDWMGGYYKFTNLTAVRPKSYKTPARICSVIVFSLL